MQQAPNEATVLGALSRSKRLSEVPSSSAVFKKQLQSKAPNFEKALYDEICERNAVRVQVSGKTVYELAQRPQAEANKTLQSSEPLESTVSNEWISRFQARHGISCSREHGESAKAHMSSVSGKLIFVNPKIVMHAKEDVWSADELGLFFSSASRLAHVSTGN